MATLVLKYNPAFLSDDQLVAGFVIRKADLDILLQVVRDNTTESNQHLLVLGPRGIGKTTLVLRLATEVRRDPELSKKWFPIVFSEESYSVDSAGAFWLEALFHLANSTKDPQLQHSYEELVKETDDIRLRERTLAQLLDFADKQGKRLLLVVENFNMLVGDQMSDKSAWELRHTLINEPRVMLVATATTKPDDMKRQDKAMYEILKPHELKPLTVEETVALWTAQTEKKAEANRIRPIHILTGGNPRLLSILSTFAAKLSLNELMDDLLSLVDDHTDYFKGHLESLPSTERKVYTALADLWDPVTAQAVATSARLPVNTASALLGRLVDRGFVVIATKKGRTKWYQVSERLYNIYYLLRRRGSCEGRIQAIVRFMTSFYAPEELNHVVHRIADEACRLAIEARKDHYRLFEELLSRLPDDRSCIDLIMNLPVSLLSDPSAPESLRAATQGYDDFRKKEFARLLSSLNLEERQKMVSIITAKYTPKENIKELTSLSETYKCNACFWLYLGYNYEAELDIASAEKAIRRVLELDASSSLAWQELGEILKTKKERLDDAEAAFRKCISLYERNPDAWLLLGDLVYWEKEDTSAAITAYTKAVRFDPSKPRPWAMLGHIYYKKDDLIQAEKAFKRSLELLVSNKDERLESLIYTDLFYLYHAKGNVEEAIDCCRNKIRLEPSNADNWMLLGCCLPEAENYREVIEAYRKAIEINPSCGMAWSLLASALLSHESPIDEVEYAYHEALRLNPSSSVDWEGFAHFLYYRKHNIQEACDAYKKAIQFEGTALGWKLIFSAFFEVGKINEAISLAETYLLKNLENLNAHNDIAYALLSYGGEEFLTQALEWAKKAVSMKPQESCYLHTLAAILIRMGQVNEGFKHLEAALVDISAVDKIKIDWINLFVELAAKGYGKKALEILQKTPCAGILEPMIVALRLYAGEDVKVAVEIVEVAKDIVKKIEGRNETTDRRSKPE